MIGGTPDEMRLVAVALAALEEKLVVANRRLPDLHVAMRNHLSGVLARQEPALLAAEDASCDGADMCSLPLLLTYQEAAIQTRLSVSTIERAVRDGRLRAVREGRAVRIRPADLEQYVQSLTGRA